MNWNQQILMPGRADLIEQSLSCNSPTKGYSMEIDKERS